MDLSNPTATGLTCTDSILNLPLSLPFNSHFLFYIMAPAEEITVLDGAPDSSGQPWAPSWPSLYPFLKASLGAACILTGGSLVSCQCAVKKGHSGYGGRWALIAAPWSSPWEVSEGSWLHPTAISSILCCL